MSDQDDGPGKPQSPDEIAQKIADFMKKSFGGSVSFSSFPNGFDPGAEEPTEPPAPAEPEKPAERAIFDFAYRPRDIKAHLDRFVIRQDEAKKVLSIAVCDHYNHARYLKRLEREDPARAREVEFAKQNVIVVGPTGVGKTYLIKHIAELIGVPFVKADATKFSETGYVGGDVDDLVRDLVQRADGDVELAEYGIIYIDEIDKLATQGNAMGRDVSGRGVQTALLKLMEETEVPLRSPMDIQSQMQAMIDLQQGGAPRKRSVNTRHILFIVSGAFDGLQKIIAKRLRAGAIGFGADQQGAELLSEDETFRRVTTADFIDFGFEAEFIGRLPVRVVCDPLAADDLFDILKESEGSLIRQYEREFEAFGIQAEFSDGALREIARRAASEKTGARGLMTVTERILRDFKFELPGTSVTSLQIDEDLMRDPARALAHYRELGRRVDVRKVAEEAAAFAREFRQENGIELEFDPDALPLLGERAARDGTSVLALCKILFKDFQFGLKLIQKNSGRSRFPLTSDAVNDPDRFLSELVVSSYDRPRAVGEAGAGRPDGEHA